MHKQRRKCIRQIGCNLYFGSVSSASDHGQSVCVLISGEFGLAGGGLFSVVLAHEPNDSPRQTCSIAHSAHTMLRGVIRDQ